MDNKYEQKSLYRFFNVIIFLFYVFIVLSSIVLGIVFYTDREVIDATVKCQDGTTWKAIAKDGTSLLYDEAAKCGLCTNRDSKNNTYTCLLYTSDAADE